MTSNDMPERIKVNPYSPKETDRGTYGPPYCACCEPTEYVRVDKHDTAGNDKQRQEALDKKGWEKKNIQDAIQRARDYEKFRPKALKAIQKATPIGDDLPGFIIQVDTIDELDCLEFALQQADGYTDLLKEAHTAFTNMAFWSNANGFENNIRMLAEQMRDKLSAAIDATATQSCEPKESA
jgi:hypothetical protein